MPRHLILTLLVLLNSNFIFAQSTASATVHFPVNSADLDEAAESSLARTLKNLELPYRCYLIQIEGHTDADGDLAFNAALSRRRTRSVHHWLLDHGVPESAMITQSQGELAPLAPNDSEHGKARNRRVELRFTPDPAGCPSPFGFDVAQQQNTFDASQPAEFTYGPSGTKVRIPAHALVDAQGNPVTGPVTYQYREWRDPIDFLASNITMDYPRAMSGQHFHSGGMFEIRAFQADQEVFLAPGRNVDLDFVLTDSSTSYDLYAFDPANDRWHVPGTDPFATEAGHGPILRETCEESIFLGEVPDTLAMFMSMIDSGLFYLASPRGEGAINFSKLPAFNVCWSNKGYAGVDYVADLPANEMAKYLGLSISLSPIGRKEKKYRLKIHDSRGTHPELAAVRHLEMTISEAQYKRLPNDLTSKRFGDIRLRQRGGNSWRMTLKEPGRFHHLTFSAKDRRRFRPNRKISAGADYRDKLASRKNQYEAQRANRILQRQFWEYSKPMMTSSERCLPMENWLYHFGTSRGLMQERYSKAKEKYTVRPDLARQLISSYLDSLAWRYENGLSLVPRPPAITSFWQDTVVGNFMADLSVSGFGIWNCDQIRRVQKPVTVASNFVDASGKPIFVHTVSVIDGNINGVLTYTGIGEFSFSTVSPSVFIAIAQNGSRYYMDRRMVSALNLNDPSNIVLKAKAIPENVNSAGEIRSLLGLSQWGSIGMR